MAKTAFLGLLLIVANNPGPAILIAGWLHIILAQWQLIPVLGLMDCRSKTTVIAGSRPVDCRLLHLCAGQIIANHLDQQPAEH